MYLQLEKQQGEFIIELLFVKLSMLYEHCNLSKIRYFVLGQHLGSECCHRRL